MKSSNKQITKIIFTWLCFSLSVLITIFLIVNAALPGEASSNISSGVSEVVSGVTKVENTDSFQTFIRKSIGHFGLFFLNGLFFTSWIILINEKTLKLRSWALLTISFAFSVFLASLTEVIQYFTPGRTFAFLDILIDVIGFSVGLLIIKLIFHFIAKRKTNLN